MRVDRRLDGGVIVNVTIMFEIAITAFCEAFCCSKHENVTLILGVTDEETVLVRCASDPDTAPWRDTDVSMPVRITTHGIRLARKPQTETDDEKEETDHG